MMRPTVYLPLAAAVAALASTSPAAAQGRTYSTIVTGPEGVRVFRDGDDENRAALGVSLAPARGRADTLGVRVSDVNDDGPAAKAGIEEGDRIVAIDGTTLRLDPADAEDPAFNDLASRRLQRALAKHKPGDEVTLTVARGREQRTVKVKTVAASELNEWRGLAVGRNGDVIRGFASARAFGDSARARAERRPALGISLGASGSRRDTLGLFVSAVAPDGPAEKAGIVEGARVASIDGVDVRVSSADFEDPEIAALRSRRFTRELEKKKPGDDVTLRVWQNGAYRAVTVKAAASSDVYKGRGFWYSFGEGAPVMPMAPMAPMAPMPAMPPMAPLAPSVRYPIEAAVRAAVPRAAFRAAPVVAPRVRRVYQY